MRSLISRGRVFHVASPYGTLWGARDEASSKVDVDAPLFVSCPEFDVLGESELALA